MSMETLTAISPSYSPVHYKNILDQEFTFINEEGAPAKTTVYAAAKSAKGIAEKLQERVIQHYALSNSSVYPEDKRQYDKLGELCKKINSTVMFLEQDQAGFQPEESPSADSLIITTADDLERVIEELSTIQSQIQRNYLTRGSLTWYLADYIQALGKLHSE